MITIQGTPVKPGTAIAVGAVVTSAAGTNSVWPSLLKRGLDALVRQLPEADRPHAVLVCDKLEAARNVRIAGVTLVATLVQEDSVSCECETDGPCIVNLPDLLTAVGEDDIIIVDGASGLVYIDPDVQTLFGYQQVHEDFIPRNRVRITAEHIGAKTLDGIPIRVFAIVSTPGELDEAMDNGADGIYLSGHDESLYDTFFGDIAGKLTFVASPLNFNGLLSAAAVYCVPYQVVALFAEGLENEAELLMGAVDFFPIRHPDSAPPPDINTGVLAAADSDEQGRFETQAGPVALVMTGPGSVSGVASAVAEVGWQRVLAVCEASKPDVQALVRTGVRSIAVRPDLVKKVKDKVRTVSAGDLE